MVRRTRRPRKDWRLPPFENLPPAVGITIILSTTFLFMLTPATGAIAMVAIILFALVRIPLYARGDKPYRRRPRRMPQDLTAWRHLAEGLGAKFRKVGAPRITGHAEGVRFAVEIRQLGGNRTVAVAELPHRLSGLLDVRPRPNPGTPENASPAERGEFYAEFRVKAPFPAMRDRLLDRITRQWILAVRPDRVWARGRRCQASLKGFVEDPDILRGLLELVLAMARTEKE